MWSSFVFWFPAPRTHGRLELRLAVRVGAGAAGAGALLEEEAENAWGGLGVGWALGWELGWELGWGQDPGF